jgi:hypothetical protein
MARQAALLGTALLLAACSNPGDPGETRSANTDQPGPPASPEQLRLIAPDSWELTASSQLGGFARARYQRQSPERPQDAAAPVETLTLEQLDPDGLADPIAFLDNLAAEQAARCDDFSSTIISSGYENGYPTAVRLMRCPLRRVNRTATVSLAKAIAGNSRYYLLVFEKRAATSTAAGADPVGFVSEEDIASWALYLRQATLCDSSQPAEHPCARTPPSEATDS